MMGLWCGSGRSSACAPRLLLFTSAAFLCLLSSPTNPIVLRSFLSRIDSHLKIVSSIFSCTCTLNILPPVSPHLHRPLSETNSCRRIRGELQTYRRSLRRYTASSRPASSGPRRIMLFARPI